jgi:glutamyl-tRNA synthetase
MVRVRFAPSPTGYLHIGGARTALFNWLFAKNQKGEFILRVEDTDKERSKPEFEEDIIKGLKNLGLEWDEFYRQSERTDFYEERLKLLLDEGQAYPCFCAKEELEIEREAMLAQGIAPKYSGRCRRLNRDQIKNKIAAHDPYVIRLKTGEEEKIIFKDLIRGQVEFDAGLIGDIVIAKSLREPLYNFSAAVDDSLMAITHVIRGEDHLSNTPKQILIFQALGVKEPLFAHLPMILNPDRSKMSKRYGDVALGSYLNDGYLPEAVVNFLILLGWHPGSEKEIMSLSELVEEFDLKRVQKAGAIFNLEKLNWMNKQYIARLDPSELAGRCSKFLPDNWKLTPAILEMIRGRLVKLSEVRELAGFIFEEPVYPKEMLFWQGRGERTLNNLKKIYEIISGIKDSEFQVEILTDKILAFVPDRQKGDFLWPLRVALSGREASAGPFEILSVLGRKESLKRVQNAVQKLRG